MRINGVSSSLFTDGFFGSQEIRRKSEAKVETNEPSTMPNDNVLLKLSDNVKIGNKNATFMPGSNENFALVVSEFQKEAIMSEALTNGIVQVNALSPLRMPI